MRERKTAINSERRVGGCCMSVDGDINGKECL